MAHLLTVEGSKLVRANELIEASVRSSGQKESAKLSVLEIISCYYSGIPEGVYREITGYENDISASDEIVHRIITEIDTCGIPVALALASLARIEIDKINTKRNGAVYTDFRLAKYLANSVMGDYSGGPIIDPSCGTSIVLAACTEERCAGGNNAEKFVSENLYGIDLSPLAIRGSILALATYLRDSSNLRLLIKHFACGDSLALADGVSESFGLKDFAAIVGNPPWERVRPSRIEYAKEHGLPVDYGAELSKLPEGYEQHRNARRVLSNELSMTYSLKGGMDLYRAFLKLSIKLCSKEGCVALYLPAGLIRSKSLASTRSLLVKRFGKIDFSVFTNKDKYFDIDTRFKFVLVILKEKYRDSSDRGICFQYCSASDDNVYVESKLVIDNYLFNDISMELGVPEVKSDAEKKTLKHIWHHAERMSNHQLFGGVNPVRELDMTLDRHLFRKAAQIDGDCNLIPLIEGRMVSQFRCGCKEYLSGAGRSAKWGIVPAGASQINSQFYIDEADLSLMLSKRIKQRRIGFCDIAGQTNERAMQAAFIPSGCVCGNKVPTLLFEDDNVAMLWLGIVNSFTFDWIVRRYITTTINFFILKNLPLPSIDLNDNNARLIIDCVNHITKMENGDSWSREELWSYALDRARLEAFVIDAYKLSTDMIEVIFADFPLVDQLNTKICNGMRPTIDLIYAVLANDVGAVETIRDACSYGAMPFMPNEYIRTRIKNQSYK